VNVVSQGNGVTTFPVQNFQVLRLNPDGSPDATFGVNGVATITPPANYVIPSTGDLTRSSPAAVFATSTGQIEVVGTLFDNRPAVAQNNPFIAALNPNGSPVSGFGTGGISILPLPNTRVVAATLVVAATTQGDQVLVLGDMRVADAGSPMDQHPVVARLTSGGQLDSTFGTAGTTTLTASTLDFPVAFENPVGFGVDGQGRIVVAARTAQTQQSEAYRLSQSGLLDKTFAQTGAEVLASTFLTGTSSVAVQPDGEVVLTGYGPLLPGLANPPTKVLRLNADGTPGTSFTFSETSQPLFLAASAIQSDGKILLAGKGTTATAGGPYAVVRLLQDLTPDTNFGVANGELTFTDINQSGGVLTAVVVDSNNNILVTGNNVTVTPPPFGSTTGGSLIGRLTGTATSPPPPPPPSPSADLAIFESDTISSSASYPGDLIISLSVRNLGPNDATNVVVTDKLPNVVNLVVAAPSQGGPALLIQGTITDNLGTIPVGQTATLTIVLQPFLSSPPIDNSASVTSTVADPNPANNSVTRTITIPAPPTVDLQLTQTTSTPVARRGQIELFVVTITNRGNAAAPGVVFSDIVSSNGVLFYVGPTQGTVRSLANGLAIVDIGTLAPNASASVYVVVMPNATGALVNSAAASGTLSDANPVDNLTILGVLSVDGPVVQAVARGGNGSSAVVSFDEALDPTSARQRANYWVVDLGLRSLHRSTGRTVAVRSVSYAPGSKTVQVVTSGRLNPTHQYALILGGSKPRGLLDTLGRRLVGNGSGIAAQVQANSF